MGNFIKKTSIFIFNTGNIVWAELLGLSISIPKDSSPSIFFGFNTGCFKKIDITLHSNNFASFCCSDFKFAQLV